MNTTLRTILRLIHGKYNKIGEHYTKTTFNRYSSFTAQGSSTTTCLYCGETHRRKSQFSDTCTVEGKQEPST